VEDLPLDAVAHLSRFRHGGEQNQARPQGHHRRQSAEAGT
jgi:hypothetical protein